MKIQRLRPALVYAISRKKPTLVDVIQKRKDADLALYILDVAKPDVDAFQLGLALAYAVENAGRHHETWHDIINKICQQPNVAEIWTGMLSSCLITAARNHNVDATRQLLALPQVSKITKNEWDGVLMEALPKGDPEKKRIETRAFEDRDGHPDILSMVRTAMAKRPVLAEKTPKLQRNTAL